METLPSIVRMQDATNANLTWITETTGGQKIERTEEKTEVVNSTSIVDVNEREQIVTEVITRTTVKKRLSVLNNNTTE